MKVQEITETTIKSSMISCTGILAFKTSESIDMSEVVGITYS
jgi:hypothetical protein